MNKSTRTLASKTLIDYAIESSSTNNIENGRGQISFGNKLPKFCYPCMLCLNLKPLLAFIMLGLGFNFGSNVTIVENQRRDCTFKST
jgi:hypothetical protein